MALEESSRSVWAIFLVIIIAWRFFHEVPYSVSHGQTQVEAHDETRNKNANLEKQKTFGGKMTQFGDCMPYCDTRRLKMLLVEFLDVYANRPFPAGNTCGCQVNHCFYNYVMAKISKAPSIVESGVNAGMSGYLFRQALPEAEVWHIDPLSRPICDPQSRSRWKDTGKCHYFVGPSDSIFYKKSAGSFRKSDGADAADVAALYGSQGFRDFFEVNWSNTSFDKNNGFVFFDNHVIDFDNIIKATALGFKTFLIDDNYRPPNFGDMKAQSIKQVLHRGGGQAFNLASTLDFYYEFPPIINPFLNNADMQAKYPKVYDNENVPKGFGFDIETHELGYYQEPLLDMNDERDQILFERVASIVPHSEFGWYNHMAVMGRY